MAKTEKIAYILEQVRLCLDRKDFVRAQVGGWCVDLSAAAAAAPSALQSLMMPVVPSKSYVQLATPVHAWRAAVGHMSPQSTLCVRVCVCVLRMMCRTSLSPRTPWCARCRWAACRREPCSSSRRCQARATRAAPAC